VRRPNVLTSRTVMMAPLQIPPASEARSASLTTCQHFHRLMTPKRASPKRGDSTSDEEDDDEEEECAGPLPEPSMT
jgi:hypothetical protein